MAGPRQNSSPLLARNPRRVNCRANARVENPLVAPFAGGCLCRAVRYEVSAEPLAVMNCHCRDCQYSSGGAYTTAVVVPKAAFRLTKGSPKRFASKGDSGA